MRRLWPFFAVAVLLLSCAEPSVREFFMRTEDRYPGEPFSLTLPVRDSAAIHSMSLLVESGCGRDVFASFEDMTMLMTLESPSGILVRDTLTIGKEAFTERSYFGRQAFPHYKDFVPGESGDWTLRVYVPEIYLHDYEIGGVGLRCSR